MSATPAQLKALHACIKKVTEDLDGMRFNTAISAMMVFINEAMTWESKPAAALKTFLQMLAPFAPHVAEELWDRLHSKLGIQSSSLTYSPWPTFDPVLLVEVLSPGNKAKTWTNIWAYTTIPTVKQLLVVGTTKVDVKLITRQADGTWPDTPESLDRDAVANLDCIKMVLPVAEIYRDTRLDMR